MFYYNNVDLELFLKVISIDTTLVSNRENIFVDIPSKNGQIYRGFKYGVKKIKIKCDIKENSELDLYDTLDALSTVFDVDEPKALRINDTGRVYFAVLDGEIDRSRITKGMERLELNFICPEPCSYNTDAQIFNGTKTLLVENNGNIPALPLINLSFQNSARYVQIDNDTGDSILIGTYPTLEKENVEERTRVIDEPCETTTNFTTAGSGVDVNRAITGTISPNDGSSSYCIKVADFGTGDKWHGPALRLNLPDGTANLSSFEVKVKMGHNSKGVLEYNETCETNKVSTTKYKVTAKTVNLKEKRLSSSKTLLSIKKDVYLQPTEVTNGWIKTTYSGKAGWVKISTGLKKVTTTTANYYTTQSASLRASGSKSSKLLMTVPKGKPVIYLGVKSGKYSKCKYNNTTGYIYTEYLVAGSNVTVETDKEYDIAENKVGLVECYGYSQTGVKLFRLGLYDDQDYFESTYPVIQVGNTDFLKDTGFKVPNPKVRTDVSESGDSLTIKKTTLNSGKYGSWNEFVGNLIIRREQGKWTAKIVKYNDENEIVKTLEVKTPQKNSSYPTGDLNHLVFYFAGYGTKPTCDTLTVNHITVTRLNKIEDQEANLNIIKPGDDIVIDCANNKVYKNNELFMQYVDIGSNFFEVPVGETTYKISSDDSDISSSIIFNERWLN